MVSGQVVCHGDIAARNTVFVGGRAIPYRRVGNRRKVLLVDLVEYKRRDEAMRREIADELTREAQEIGLGY